MERKKEIVHIRYRQLKNGGKSIYFEVSRNGSRTYLYQEERLLPETCESDIRHNNEVRRMIEERKRKLAAELILDRGEMEDHSLSTDITLLEWMDHHYKEVIQTATRSYLPNFRIIRNLIEEYRPDILLRDVDEDFIIGLYYFMQERSQVRDPTRTMAGSSIHFYLNYQRPSYGSH